MNAARPSRHRLYSLLACACAFVAALLLWQSAAFAARIDASPAWSPRPSSAIDGADLPACREGSDEREQTRAWIGDDDDDDDDDSDQRGDGTAAHGDADLTLPSHSLRLHLDRAYTAAAVFAERPNDETHRGKPSSACSPRGPPSLCVR